MHFDSPLRLLTILSTKHNRRTDRTSWNKFALCRVGLLLVVGTVELALTGCTAIPLSRLKPPADAPSVTSCVNSNANEAARLLVQGDTSTKAPEFRFLIPPRRRDPQNTQDSKDTIAVLSHNPVMLASQQVATFKEYAAALEHIKTELPPSIQNDVVTDDIVRIMTVVTAESQLNSAFAANPKLTTSGDVKDDITSYKLPRKITHGQLKAFADKFFDKEFQPNLLSLAGAEQKSDTKDAANTDVFVAYFKTYYDGKFVDRLGQAVTKPAISSTIPDSEIAAAETVLFEYIMDRLDQTPVFGDQPDSDKATKFYPGGSSASKPTVLTVDKERIRYQQIQDSGCGVTTANICLLTGMANGAADRAATVGGLVANTPGGLSIGLGVIGKISIGDNQTLSTLVKTAASRLALRLTYAAAYWSIQNVEINVSCGS